MADTFFGHPRGLATLFLTEMWERFTFYGMRALLVLFLVAQTSAGGFGLTDKTAVAIYGLYNAGVYLAGLPGGWIADRLIGAQNAVLAGGVAIIAGNSLLALAGSPDAFYLGLLVIVLGVGLLKPNTSALVAGLYPEGGARLDSGFTLYYIGINVGAFLGPLVAGEAQVLYGSRAGFAAGALVMVIGVAQFLMTRRHLNGAGAYARLEPIAAAARRRDWRWFGMAVAVALILIVAVSLGVIPVAAPGLARAMTYLILGMTVLYFFYYLVLADLSPVERKRGVVLVVLFIGTALFFSGFEQAGSSLNLFAERYTERVVAWPPFVIPATWFQSLNSLFIFIFAPFFAWLWIFLAQRHLNPSAPAKFALGVILMGSGFLLMAAAAAIVAGGTKVLPYWLALTYLLHTFGELCLSPVGLSYFSKLAAKRFVGQMIGLFFLAISLGNLVASLIAGDFDGDNVSAMPGQYLHIVYFSVGLGVVLLLLSRPVKRLMGGIA